MKKGGKGKYFLSALIILILVASSVATFGTPLSRDSGDNGKVWGKMYDADTNETVAEVHIILRNYEEGYRFEQYTDENGSYRFHADAGEYTLQVSGEEYNTYEENITVPSGEGVRHDVSLQPYNTVVFGYVSDEDGEPI